MLYLHSESNLIMTDPKQVYIVIDYWIEEDKVYALFIKEGILYFLEDELQS